MASLKYRTSDETEIETNGESMESVTNNYLASLLITGNQRRACTANLFNSPLNASPLTATPSFPSCAHPLSANHWNR